MKRRNVLIGFGVIFCILSLLIWSEYKANNTPEAKERRRIENENSMEARLKKYTGKGDLLVAKDGIIWVVRHNEKGEYLIIKANSFPEKKDVPSNMKKWVWNIIKESDTPVSYGATAAEYVKQ